MTTAKKTLGAMLAQLRAKQGWTLKEMSLRSGIPMSTLSKVEHDRLSLTYDKLQQLGQRLNIRMADLFAEDEGSAAKSILGRRSIGKIENSVRVATENYEYHYICTELRQKRMVPVVTRILTKSIEDFGDLLRHSGEEFTYVVKGRIVVHTEFYGPVELGEGESIYIDAGMGHAYVCAESVDEAVTVSTMSSPDEDPLQQLPV